MDNPYAPPSAVVADVVMSATGVEPASRLQRLGGAFLDGIAMMIMIYVPFIAGLLTSGVVQNPNILEESPETLLGAFLFAGIGWIVWMVVTLILVIRTRQSIGKKLVGIKVVRRDGATVSMARLILLRNVLNGIIGAIPFLGVVYSIVDMLFIFRDDQQCLHDKLADTIVVTA